MDVFSEVKRAAERGDRNPAAPKRGAAGHDERVERMVREITVPHAQRMRDLHGAPLREFVPDPHAPRQQAHRTRQAGDHLATEGILHYAYQGRKKDLQRLMIARSPSAAGVKFAADNDDQDLLDLVVAAVDWERAELWDLRRAVLAAAHTTHADFLRAKFDERYAAAPADHQQFLRGAFWFYEATVTGDLDALQRGVRERGYPHVNVVSQAILSALPSGQHCRAAVMYILANAPHYHVDAVLSRLLMLGNPLLVRAAVDSAPFAERPPDVLTVEGDGALVVGTADARTLGKQASYAAGATSSDAAFRVVADLPKDDWQFFYGVVAKSGATDMSRVLVLPEDVRRHYAAYLRARTTYQFAMLQRAVHESPPWVAGYYRTAMWKNKAIGERLNTVLHP